MKTIANDKKNKNTDIEQMAKNCTESEEDAPKVLHEFEGIVKNKKKWHSMASLPPRLNILKVQIKRTIC